MQDVLYPVGTVLKIRCSTYWHYGMSDGQGGVIHNSKKRRRVQFDTLEEFSDGKEIVVSSIGGEDPEQAFINSQKYLGVPYNLFNQNCEQFVRESHGLPVECTQLQRFIVLMLGGYLVLRAQERLIKLAGIGLLCGGLTTPSEKKPYRRAIIGAQFAVGSAILFTKVVRLLVRRSRNP
ncbi:lecithin retinol acyltransferase family protein [Pseudomonadota bacterium]